MHYEPESYFRPIPESDKITHLPTGDVYETLWEACMASGISFYKMRKLIADGSEWYRPDSVKILKKRVRCIETRKIYASIADAARAHGVTPAAMSAHLSGRIRAVKGFRFELTGKHTSPKKRKKVKRKKRPVHISKQFREWAIRIDPEGIFREAWRDKKVFVSARFDGKWYWINGAIPTDSLDKFREALRAFNVHEIPVTGDLFK